jgi:hypothetical protein
LNRTQVQVRFPTHPSFHPTFWSSGKGSIVNSRQSHPSKVQVIFKPPNLVVLQQEKDIRIALTSPVRIDKNTGLCCVFRLSIQEKEEGNFHFLLTLGVPTA